MYDYRCKECKNLEHCMPMMDMPMENMPMMNMPMMNMPMMNMPMMNMPMENMSMMNMPMMNMPMYEGNDEDLKSMYPKVYIRMHPMVKHHCDKMVAKYGIMYCPSKEEMHHMCKDIADKYKEHHKDDDDDCNDEGMRVFGGGGALQDLARILIIGNLIGGRNFYGY